MNTSEINVSLGGFALAFWLFFWGFVFFWGQSGWYRVDCALHVAKACELIKAEYDKKEKP